MFGFQAAMLISAAGVFGPVGAAIYLAVALNRRKSNGATRR